MFWSLVLIRSDAQILNVEMLKHDWSNIMWFIPSFCVHRLNQLHQYLFFLLHSFQLNQRFTHLIIQMQKQQHPAIHFFSTTHKFYKALIKILDLNNTMFVRVCVCVYHCWISMLISSHWAFTLCRLEAASLSLFSKSLKKKKIIEFSTHLRTIARTI